MAAWECHRSQHNPKGFSATMPDGMRREMAANEQYVLAAARIPLPEGASDDLLAGLAAEEVMLTRECGRCGPWLPSRWPRCAPS